MVKTMAPERAAERKMREDFGFMGRVVLVDCFGLADADPATEKGGSETDHAPGVVKCQSHRRTSDFSKINQKYPKPSAIIKTG